MKYLTLSFIFLIGAFWFSLSSAPSAFGQAASLWVPSSGAAKTVNATWGLFVPGLATSTTGCLSVASNGWISASGSACGSGSGSGFSTTSADYWVTASTTIPKTTLAQTWNALQTFASGFLSQASSTIGGGGITSGLTVSGAATTSQHLIVQGTGTSTFTGGLDFTRFNTSATSTGSQGINLTGGCFSVNGTCVGGAADGTASSTLLSDRNTWSALNIFSNASTTLLSGTTAWFTTFIGSLTGNASTATSLAADGTDCSAGSYALGVDQSGNAEDCTDATTEINSAITTNNQTFDTESELETFLTDVTNVFTNNDGALADDDITNNSIEDLSDVATFTQVAGDFLFYNGSAWDRIASSTLRFASSTLLSDNNTFSGTNVFTAPLFVGTSTTANVNDAFLVMKSGITAPMRIGGVTYSNTANSGTAFSSYRARGTVASPSVPQADDNLFSLGGSGFTGTGWPSGQNALLTFKAAETFDTSGQGTYMTFETTPIDSTSRVEWMRLDSTGNVGIGTTSPYAKLSVVGETVASHFTATTTTASSFPYASTTAWSITSTSTGTNGINLSGGCFAISGTCVTGAGDGTASSTLLTDNNTFTGLNIFSRATSTLFTGTNAWLTNATSTNHTVTGNTILSGITSALLGTNNVGLVVSTTTIGESLLHSSITRDTEWDTESKVQIAWGSINILLETEIDGCSELLALLDDETGTCGGAVFSTGPTISSTTLSGSTLLTNATSTNLAVTNLFTFGGVVGNSWDDFCTTITGGSGLCDGVDAEGAGGTGSTKWATTSNGLAIHPTVTTADLLLGSDATSSASAWFDVSESRLQIGSSSPITTDAALAISFPATKGGIIASSSPGFVGNFLQFTNSAGTEVAAIDYAGNASTTHLTTGTAWLTALFIGADTIAEYIADTAGAMFTGNTESGITVTYQDSDNTTDFTVAAGVTNLTSSDFGDWTCNGSACSLDDDVVAAAELADADWGDISISSGVASIDANSVALGTDTTNNYVATLSSSGSITVANSGTESAAVTADLNMGNANTWTAKQTFGAASTTQISSTYATTSLLYVDGLGSCAAGQYITWSAGRFTCATDQAGSGAWPFTPTTYVSTAVQSTSTPLWLTATSPFSLIASSTFATQASTTMLTNTGNTYLTGLTSALLGTNNLGLVVSTTTIGESLLHSSVTRDTEWDTESEVQIAWGSINILLETEIDGCSEIKALLDDETGNCGGVVFSSSPSLATPSIAGATMTGTINAGGADDFVVPHSTAAGAASLNQGSYVFDETSNNFIGATSTSGHFVVASATSSLTAFKMASTSPDAISGGITDIAKHRTIARTVIAIYCSVDSGTSQQIFLSDGTNDTNTITCTTTPTQFAITTNRNWNAYENWRLELATKTGSWDYLDVEVLGYLTSD